MPRPHTGLHCYQQVSPVDRYSTFPSLDAPSLRHLPGYNYFSVNNLLSGTNIYMHLYFARRRQSKINKQTRKQQAKNKYTAKEINTIPPW